jgi:hypothetical protein
MKRYINLRRKPLKQLKRPTFAKQNVIAMPKRNLSETNSAAAKNILKPQLSSLAKEIKFKGREVELWRSLRILNFLNRAQTIADLTEVEERDNNYSIGTTVAERILNKKNELPSKQFTTLFELTDVPGFGVDKFNDLVLLLDQKADEYFSYSLFDDLLLSNWKVRPYRIEIEDRLVWSKLMQSSTWLQMWLSDQLKLLSEQISGKKSSLRANEFVRTAYIDYFTEEEIGSYAFALSWYQIDMDNWFSFSAILDKIRTYLAYYSHPKYSLTLALLKGFPMYLLNTKGISTSDLPIILNPAEQSVTFWVIELMD